MTDREAIEALQRGDHTGMDSLVRAHQVKAQKLAYQIIRDLEAAEDVVADAFLAVFQNVKRQDASLPFEPWFFRIVTNRAISVARRSARFRRLAHLFHVGDAIASPVEIAEQHEEYGEIIRALSQLPATERAALSLRYLMDLDEQAIADILGWPLGTVKTRLHRGRNRLRTQLRAEGHDILAFSSPGGLK